MMPSWPCATWAGTSSTAANSPRTAGQPELTAALRETRAAVAACDDVLSFESYTQIKRLHRWVSSRLAPEERTSRLSPEYAHAEFLACVKSTGEISPIPLEVCTDFQRVCAAEPDFARWFQLAQPDGSGRTLLPARWLCHLLGLRHGTVHLVIAVPHPHEQLLLQVRSMRKHTWSGCYDLPVAGHVDGLQTYPATLRKEAQEEIGLEIDWLQDLVEVGGYLDSNSSAAGFFYDNEYHRVFTGCLARDLLPRLQPLAGEVAALALFPPAEIHAMRAAYPDSFAPGIQQTFDRFFPPPEQPAQA